MATKQAPLAQSANSDEVDQINKRLSKILETRLDTDKVNVCIHAQCSFITIT